MTDLADLDQVKTLQAHLRATLDTPAGVELVKFLEDVCGWYDFSETDPNLILVAHGKRQVLATIKTLLRCTPDQIVTIAQPTE